jgi:hypothetical protein
MIFKTKYGTIPPFQMLEKFSSIEPIIQQESQFLRIQSDRIVSAHISLLVSENGVPLTVQDWLMKESISTLANVKVQSLSLQSLIQNGYG